VKEATKSVPRSGSRASLAVALLACVALLVGCASGNHAAVSRTTTVVRTVTEATPPAPRPRPIRPFAPTYTSYDGSYVSVDYPDTWNVEAAEVSKGGVYDTTIRSVANPDVMLRVDMTPTTGSAIDISSAARGVEQGLVTQPGYRELAFTPTTFQGYDAVDWRFLVLEHGVLLHKEDTFFLDYAGDGVAILTQAPAGQFWRWASAFAHIRQSLSILPPEAAPPPTAVGGSEADFCSTHACIDNFYNGSGYIVQCNDGMWSHSGGLQGACSYHGGESGTTYP
jgi:hypothetical protein